MDAEIQKGLERLRELTVQGQTSWGESGICNIHGRFTGKNCPGCNDQFDRTKAEVREILERPKAVAEGPITVQMKGGTMTLPPKVPERRHSHWFRTVNGQELDVYRLIMAFEVLDPAVIDAVKLLLLAGSRGSPWHEDILRAMDALSRALEIYAEDVKNQVR